MFYDEWPVFLSNQHGKCKNIYTYIRTYYVHTCIYYIHTTRNVVWKAVVL